MPELSASICTACGSQFTPSAQPPAIGGDIVMVVPDRNSVSFMGSFPNLVPLSAPAVEKVGAALEPFEFETIYGPFFDRDIRKGGKEVVRRSVKRYVDAINRAGIAEQL